VFVVKDGRAVQVAVKRGMKIGELVEVTGKVAVGDKVVVRPSEKLHDGSALATASK
jgi:hypothetical protein